MPEQNTALLQQLKELVENAIDAGATSITVEIKEGGISYIRVTDNGYGIAKEQVKMAFVRHATNKIVLSSKQMDVCSLLALLISVPTPFYCNLLENFLWSEK
jgi:DNA mismatch repair ATPase MutL